MVGIIFRKIFPTNFKERENLVCLNGVDANICIVIVFLHYVNTISGA